MSEFMLGVRAHFQDKFGVVVEVQTPYSAEDLYTLWQATKQGAKVTILVRGANKRVMRVDLRDLDSEKTFTEIIVTGYATTSVPPPPLMPQGLPEMAVFDPRDTLPEENRKTPVGEE